MQCYCNATYLIYQTYAEKNQLLILKKNKKKKKLHLYSLNNY